MRTRHRTKVPGIYYRIDAHGARRYIVWFTDSRGKAHTEHMPRGYTLEDAKEHRAKLVNKPMAPTKIVVGELLDEWFDKRKPALSENTQLVYAWGIRHVKEEIGDVKVKRLTADDLVGMRQKWVKEGYKKHSISKFETPLRMALRAAFRDGLINSSPFDKLLTHERVKPDQKEMRCLNSDEVKRLLKPGVTTSEHWRVLFTLLIFSGLRISEALQLSWDDVDLSNGLVHVRKGKTKNATRSVPLIAATGRLLRAHKLQSDPGTTRVFTVSHSGARDALNRACKAAGIPRVSLHELRHTFVSLMIDLREPLPSLAKMVGHSSPNLTLEIYAHLFDGQDRMEESRDRLQESFLAITGGKA